MEYKGVSVQDAAKMALQKAKDLGGSGGLIAMDKAGHFAMPFNTSGMYRGSVDSEGKIAVEIYR
jgi:beta-aspartyl-peptidase (threonine type)